MKRIEDFEQLVLRFRARVRRRAYHRRYYAAHAEQRRLDRRASKWRMWARVSLGEARAA